MKIIINSGIGVSPKPGKILDQVREVMRYHHYAIRTEQTYVKSVGVGPSYPIDI